MCLFVLKASGLIYTPFASTNGLDAVIVDSIYNGIQTGYDNCPLGLLDGDFRTKPHLPSNTCCTKTDDTTANASWINISFTSPKIFRSVLIINNEDDTIDCESESEECWELIKGSYLRVSNSDTPTWNNWGNHCHDEKPKSSGFWDCNGSQGTKLAVYKEAQEPLVICEIKIYSYKVNKDVHFKKCGHWNAPDPWACYQCTMPAFQANITDTGTAPCFANSYTSPGENAVQLDFAGSPYFVQVLTLIGNYNDNDYEESSSFEICVSNDDGATCDFAYTSTAEDRTGKEITVLKMATSVWVKRTDGNPLGFRHIGVYTTVNDCTGPFVWPEWPTTQLHIKDTTNIQTYPFTYAYKSVMSDCAIAHTAKQANGDPLPGNFWYNPYSGTFTFRVEPDATPTIWYLQVTAYMNDGYTTYRVQDSPVLPVEVLVTPPVSFGPTTSPITMFFPRGQQTDVDLMKYFTTDKDWSELSITTTFTDEPYYVTPNGNGYIVGDNATGTPQIFHAVIQDSVFGLTSEPLIIYSVLFDDLLLVDNDKLTSKDFLGTISHTCQLPLYQTGHPPDNACDFTDIYTLGQVTSTTDDNYNRAFYVQFQTDVQIYSFFADVMNSIEVDVYISYGDVVRDDSRWLCRKAINLNGTFNCPYAMAGSHLIFWASPNQNLANFQVREFRAWRKKDHAAIGDPVDIILGTLRTNNVQASSTYKSTVGAWIDPLPGVQDFVNTFTHGGWFIIDLGSRKDISELWLYYGDNQGQTNSRVMISIMYHEPTEANPPYREDGCFYHNVAGDGGEWEEWIKFHNAGWKQYILIGKTSDWSCNWGAVDDTLSIRKAAIFDKDRCGWGPNVKLATNYRFVEYGGDGIGFDIPWPNYNIDPDKCFGMKDLQFKDLDGNWITDGTVAVDWVAKTIKYKMPEPERDYDYRLQMVPTFNPVTAYNSPGDPVHLLLCTKDWYVWLNQPDPKIIPYIDPAFTSKLTGYLNKQGCIPEMMAEDNLIFYQQQLQQGSIVVRNTPYPNSSVNLPEGFNGADIETFSGNQFDFDNNIELKATYSFQYDITPQKPGEIPVGASWKSEPQLLDLEVYKIILLTAQDEFKTVLTPGGILDETIIDATEMFSTNMHGKRVGYEKSDLKFEMECTNPSIGSDPEAALANDCCTQVFSMYQTLFTKHNPSNANMFCDGEYAVDIIAKHKYLVPEYEFRQSLKVEVKYDCNTLILQDYYFTPSYTAELVLWHGGVAGPPIDPEDPPDPTTTLDFTIEDPLIDVVHPLVHAPTAHSYSCRVQYEFVCPESNGEVSCAEWTSVFTTPTHTETTQINPTMVTDFPLQTQLQVPVTKSHKAYILFDQKHLQVNAYIFSTDDTETDTTNPQYSGAETYLGNVLTWKHQINVQLNCLASFISTSVGESSNDPEAEASSEITPVETVQSGNRIKKIILMELADPYDTTACLSQFTYKLYTSFDTTPMFTFFQSTAPQHHKIKLDAQANEEVNTPTCQLSTSQQIQAGTPVANLVYTPACDIQFSVEAWDSTGTTKIGVYTTFTYTVENECFNFGVDSPIAPSLWTLPNPDPSDEIPPLSPLILENNLYEIWRSPVPKEYYLPTIIPSLFSEKLGHPTATDECGPFKYAIDPEIAHFATLVIDPLKSFPILKIESGDTAVSGQDKTVDYTKFYLINLSAKFEKFPTFEGIQYEITKSFYQPVLPIKMIDRCLGMYFKKPYLEVDGIIDRPPDEDIQDGAECTVGELDYILADNPKWFKVENTKPYLYVLQGEVLEEMANGKCGDFYYRPQEIEGVGSMVNWKSDKMNDQFAAALEFTLYTYEDSAVGTKTLTILKDSEHGYPTTTFYVNINTEKPPVPIPCITRFDRQDEQIFYTYTQEQPNNDAEINAEVPPVLNSCGFAIIYSLKDAGVEVVKKGCAVLASDQKSIDIDTACLDKLIPGLSKISVQIKSSDSTVTADIFMIHLTILDKNGNGPTNGGFGSGNSGNAGSESGVAGSSGTGDGTGSGSGGLGSGAGGLGPGNGAVSPLLGNDPPESVGDPDFGFYTPDGDWVAYSALENFSAATAPGASPGEPGGFGGPGLSDPPDSVGDPDYGFYSPNGDWVSFSMLDHLASGGPGRFGGPGGLGGAGGPGMQDPPGSVGDPDYGYYDDDGAWVSYSSLGIPGGPDGAGGGSGSLGGALGGLGGPGGLGGYYDADGNWVPVSGGAGGYYDEDGNWVADNSEGAGGYYDEDGNWVADNSGNAEAYDEDGDYSDVDVLTQLSYLSQEDHDNFFGDLESSTKWQTAKRGKRKGESNQPLYLMIEEIKYTGHAKLRFNRQVNLNIQFLTNYNTRSRRLKSKEREEIHELEDMRADFKKMIYKMLTDSFEIEFIPKTLDYPTELLKFEILKFSEYQYIDLKMEFTEPLHVSYNRISREEYDRVKIFMIFPQIFKDIDLDRVLTSNVMPDEKVPVPPQMPGQFDVLVDASGATADTFSQATGAIVFLNIFGGLSLRKIWKAVNLLQFTIYANEWKISPPPNAKYVIEKIAYFCRGEWLPREEILALINMNTDDAQTKQTRFMLLITGLGLIFAILVVVVFFCIEKRRKKWTRVSNWAKEFKQWIFWNAFLRLLMQSYLDYCVSIALISFFVEGSSWGWARYTISGILTFFMCLVVIFFLRFLSVLYFDDMLEDEDYKQKFGTLWSGLRVNDYMSVNYYTVFLFRRLVFSVVSVHLGLRYGGLVLIGVIYISMFYQAVYLLEQRPNAEPFEQKLEVFSECCLLYFFYSLLMTETCASPIVMFQWGWFTVVCFALLFITQVYAILHSALSKYCVKLKYWYMRSKYYKKQLQCIKWRKDKQAAAKNWFGDKKTEITFWYHMKFPPKPIKEKTDGLDSNGGEPDGNQGNLAEGFGSVREKYVLDTIKEEDELDFDTLGKARRDPVKRRSSNKDRNIRNQLPRTMKHDSTKLPDSKATGEILLDSDWLNGIVDAVNDHDKLGDSSSKFLNDVEKAIADHDKLGDSDQKFIPSGEKEQQKPMFDPYTGKKLVEHHKIIEHHNYHNHHNTYNPNGGTTAQNPITVMGLGEDDMNGQKRKDDEKDLWYAKFNAQIKDLEKEVGDTPDIKWYARQEVKRVQQKEEVDLDRQEAEHPDLQWYQKFEQNVQALQDEMRDEPNSELPERSVKSSRHSKHHSRNFSSGSTYSQDSKSLMRAMQTTRMLDSIKRHHDHDDQDFEIYEYQLKHATPMYNLSPIGTALPSFENDEELVSDRSNIQPMLNIPPNLQQDFDFEAVVQNSMKNNKQVGLKKGGSTYGLMDTDRTDR